MKTRFTRQDIETIVKLRQEGLVYTEIGKRLNAEHSKILYWCKKLGVQKGTKELKVVKMEREGDGTRKPQVADYVGTNPYYTYLYEPIKQGKMYADYIAEEEARKERKWKIKTY